MTIGVRVATFDDVALLQQLIPASVRSLSTDHYTSRQLESALTYVFGVDSQLIADGTYYVAEVYGCLVGCGGWSKRSTLYGGDQAKTTGDSLLDPARDPGRIRAFFVHPQWARRGIGRRIIQVCEEAARRAGFDRLELAATLPGEPLYTAVGYQAGERTEIPFPDGETFPIVRMTKSFLLGL
ncbi:MAG: GNAT family N-acetyltransferase [Ferruginibacter sp.]|nr:GNAT family N-acetyltransferase [Cytophagales bacterium]